MIRSLALAALLLLVASPGTAVLIADGDGTGNTSSLGFFGWDYVGEVGAASATYLGDGWVITANHVGPGDLTLGGVVYPWVPGSEYRPENDDGSSLADLVMFRVSPEPELDPLPLRTTPPPLREFTLLIGCGLDRGNQVAFDPNGPWPPELLDGWEWLPSRTKRWGANEVEGFPVGLVGGTVAFFTSFDEGEPVPEGQGVHGDSGGAVFTLGANGTELAGILYAIGAAPGQPGSTTLYTNLSFAARIDFYHDQIVEVMPEPTGVLPWGALLVAALSQRRRSRKGTSAWGSAVVRPGRLERAGSGATHRLPPTAVPARARARARHST